MECEFKSKAVKCQFRSKARQTLAYVGSGLHRAAQGNLGASGAAACIGV